MGRSRAAVLGDLITARQQLLRRKAPSLSLSSWRRPSTNVARQLTPTWPAPQSIDALLIAGGRPLEKATASCDSSSLDGQVLRYGVPRREAFRAQFVDDCPLVDGVTAFGEILNDMEILFDEENRRPEGLIDTLEIPS